MVHHRAADRLAVGRRRELGDDAAAVHDADRDRRGARISSRSSLISRTPAPPSRALAAGAHAPRREARTSRPRLGLWARTTRGVAGEFARDDQLLRVAAGEQRRLLARAAHALHVEGADRLARSPCASPRRSTREPRAVAAGEHARHGIVVGDRQAAGEAVAVTVGGNAGDAEIAQRCSGPSPVTSAGAVELDAPGERRRARP